MREPANITKPQFITGFQLKLLKLKFGSALLKYLIRRKKYPFFSPAWLNIGKAQRELEIHKAVKFGGHYYVAIMVNPHWPSKAFDQMVAKGGFNALTPRMAQKSPICSVVLAMTRKCDYGCGHCYESSNLGKEEAVPVERWLEVTKDLQKIGANIVVYSGGEPMLRYDDLVRLIEAGDKNLSDFHVHTSGIGLTYEKALRLKAAGLQAAGIGLEDSNPERHDRFRGFRGAFQAATEALKNFNRAGVFTYTNMCLKKELIRAGDLPAYFELVRDLGVGAVLFLEPKLCGGYLARNQDDLFSADDRQTVTGFFKEANSGKKHRDYPLISYIAYFEDPRRLGCMMGGLSHLYVDSLGNVQPCLYLPVSFGNILKESFEDIVQNIRNAVPEPLHKQCPSVLLSKKIRSRKGRGLPLPLPYHEIEEEWQRIFSQSS